MTKVTREKILPGERLGRWIGRHPWRVLSLCLAGSAVLCAGLTRLQFNDSYRALFSPTNPQLRAYDEFENTFNQIDNLLFVVAPPEGDVFTDEALDIVAEMTAGGWNLPYAVRVDSITNFPYSRGEADDLIVEALFAPPRSAASIARDKERVLAEPQLLNRLIPPDGNVTGVNVNFQLARAQRGEETSILAAGRALAASIESAHPGYRVYLTGTILINTSFKEAALGDMERLGPLMFIGTAVVAWLLLRTVAGTLATAVVIGLATASAMGFMGWCGLDLTAPSSSAPVMILTLAVADCIHILSTMLKEMEAGKTRLDALATSLRVNLKAVFLTSATTAVGLLGLNFSEVPPLRDLGNIAAAGVVIAYCLSVTLLPALLMVLPLRAPGHQLEASRFFESIGRFVVRRPRGILLASILITIAAACCVPLNVLNDPFVKYFGSSMAFRRDTDFIMDHLTGMYQIHYKVDSDGPDGITDPEYLEHLDTFAAWLREQPGVLQVDAFSTIMKRLNQNMHGDSEASYRLPDDRALAAQYLLLYELSLPVGRDLTNQVSVDKSSTRLTVTMANVSSREIKELVQNAASWQAAHLPGAMQAEAMGAPVTFAYIADRNIKSMMVGALAALVAISFLLLPAVRSVKYGLVSLVPNLVPAVLAFGIWGLINGQVGLGVSVVCALTLGIVVDDTVHFLSRYVHARHDFDMTPEEAVCYAFRTIGMALFATSAVLIAGFLVLTLSSFKFNSAMGQLTAITIACALIADFFLLPALLVTVDGATAKAKETS